MRRVENPALRRSASREVLALEEAGEVVFEV
jgi:hypothetical protein